MLIARKDNLVRTSPSRVTVVIEPSRGGAVADFISIRGSCRRSENIAPGSTDQVTERRQQNRVERSTARSHSGGAAVQHRYLQTKFLIALIGFSERPVLSWRPAVSCSAATLGSFLFDGFSAITMAQYVL